MIDNHTEKFLYSRFSSGTGRVGLKKQVVFFDFDGVVVDTYKSAPFAAKRLAKHLGLRRDKIDYFTNDVSKYYENPDGSALQLFERLFRAYKLSSNRSEIGRAYELFQVWRTEEARPIGNIEEFLIWAHNNNIETKILTAPDEIRGLKNRRIKTSSITYYFDTIIVTDLKPGEIEPYAKGAETVPMFVVGDNKTLSTAAKAGLRTVRLNTGVGAFSEAAPPTFRISDFTQLETILK